MSLSLSLHIYIYIYIECNFQLIFMMIPNKPTKQYIRLKFQATFAIKQCL